jgi:hypothetical protein
MLKFARFAFGAWILVEALSWAKVLPLTLEFTWFGLILTASFAWGAIEFISWRLRKIGAQSLWGGTLLLALLSQCTDAGGDIFRLYGTYGWYDQVAHIIGGAAVALIVFNLFTSLHVAQRISLGPKLRGWIAVMGSMAIGSLYEIEEYSEDVIRHSHRLGDAFDTANDMLCNTIGAILLVLVIVWVRRRKEPQE